jgi:hypothetical protein
MTSFLQHISKPAIVIGVVVMFSLPGATMALYSISHAGQQPQAVSNTSSH